MVEEEVVERLHAIYGRGGKSGGPGRGHLPAAISARKKKFAIFNNITTILSPSPPTPLFFPYIRVRHSSNFSRPLI